MVNGKKRLTPTTIIIDIFSLIYSFLVIARFDYLPYFCGVFNLNYSYLYAPNRATRDFYQRYQ